MFLDFDLALSLNIMLATSVGYLNKYGCALNVEYFRVFVFGIFLHSCRRYSNATLPIASFTICFHFSFILLRNFSWIVWSFVMSDGVKFVHA